MPTAEHTSPIPNTSGPASPQPRLPTPDDRPAADVVFYDGDCGFCRQQVIRLARWDAGGRLAFLPSQDPRAWKWLPDVSAGETPSQMVVVDRHGKRHGGASAVRYLTRRLPRLWWAAPLLHIPLTLPLWNWLYRQIARRRHRWSGVNACPTGHCDVSSVEKRTDETGVA